MIVVFIHEFFKILICSPLRENMTMYVHTARTKKNPKNVNFYCTFLLYPRKNSVPQGYKITNCLTVHPIPATQPVKRQ